jgi:membrane-bound serine protease (ClpP class)
MWCYFLLLAPPVIAGLFLLLPWPVAVPIAGVVAVATAMIVYAGVKALRQPLEAGPRSMVGLVGEAVTDISPEGLVRVQGELWRGRSQEAVARGQRVLVEAVDGLSVRVRPVQA